MGGGEAPELGRGNPLTETNHEGEGRAEQVGQCHLTSAGQTSGLLPTLTALQMGRRPKGRTGPHVPKEVTDGTGFALSSKGLHCPERDFLSLGIPVWIRGTDVTGTRRVSPSRPPGCPSALSSCVSVFPRALEGAVSLSGLARLSFSYAPAQLWEPGWRPAGGGGVGSKGFPSSQSQSPCH